MPKHNYLAALRKARGLPKESVAHLLGVDRSVVSRVESGERHPSLHLTFAYEVIFGRQPRKMFPELYRAVEEEVINRAAELERQLSCRRSNAATRQRRHLADMVERASPSPVLL